MKYALMVCLLATLAFAGCGKTEEPAPPTTPPVEKKEAGTMDKAKEDATKAVDAAKEEAGKASDEAGKAAEKAKDALK